MGTSSSPNRTRRWSSSKPRESKHSMRVIRSTSCCTRTNFDATPLGPMSSRSGSAQTLGPCRRPLHSSPPMPKPTSPRTSPGSPTEGTTLTSSWEAPYRWMPPSRIQTAPIGPRSTRQDWPTAPSSFAALRAVGPDRDSPVRAAPTTAQPRTRRTLGRASSGSTRSNGRR